jgi:hypothetical protein
MYVTKTINGVPAIQFANWLCALLNELGQKSELLLNEQDWEWIRAIDSPFRRAAQHA